MYTKGLPDDCSQSYSEGLSSEDKTVSSSFESPIGILREHEYAYLDEHKQVYLDYTGSGLASRSQHAKHALRMSTTISGNPHSFSPTSLTATELVEETRLRVLEYFHASPDEYMVIFTSNATGAARLVGESYPFSRLTKFVLTHDNHNSVNGIREYAKKQGTKTVYVPSELPDLRINEQRLKQALRSRASMVPRRAKKVGLFAFPAQSNFSGVQHPLHLVDLAQARGYDVLLDAAAFVPTSALDLSQVKPEFVMMSWYKVFGFPTGVGCLIAKREAMARLKRPWFSGGTIQAVSVGIPWHKMAPGEAAFEDGTLNFLLIPDVHAGLDWISSVGIHQIHQHVLGITAYCLEHMQRLRHSDGSPLLKIYGPKNTTMRGGTIAFNILDEQRHVVDERLVAAAASAAKISLRTGCFCNPGTGEDIFELRLKRLSRLLWSKEPTIDEYIRLLGLPSAGTIRVSFGIASNTADVDKLLSHLQLTYKDQTKSSQGLPPRVGC